MSDSGAASVAAIAGGTSAGVVGIAAIAIGVFFLLRGRSAAVAAGDSSAAPTSELCGSTHASGDADDAWEEWQQCEGTTDIFWSDAHQLYYDATNNCYLDVHGYPVGQ